MRLPTREDRTMVLGATGEGKTVGALYILSFQPFHEMPWIIIDYKRDKTLAHLETFGAPVIYDSRRDEGKSWPVPPVEAGLYIIRPHPEDKEEMNLFLQQIWRNGNTGLFCDEAFMVPQKHRYKAYDNLLTQGRSLYCPMIMLYQRPVDMSQYATSQSEFWAVFNLRKPSDIDIAGEYVGEAIGRDGKPITVKTRLPRYYWLWYDVAEDETSVMAPVPHPDAVLEVFRKRLKPKDDAKMTGTSPVIQRPSFKLF